MRKLLIAAAAAALMAIAAPGAASAQTGYVGLNYSNGSVDDSDFDGVGAEGVVAFDAGALGVQLDAGYNNIDPDNGDSADAWNVGAHVYSRGQQWLVGGFASYADIDSDNGYTVGAEARRYFSRTTVGAALTYANSDDIDADGWIVDGDVKHFYTDNWSVGAGLSFASYDVGSENVDSWGANVGTEYQFASLPVSLYAQYAHNEYNPDNFDDFDADVVTLGVRWNFGGSLIERDRSGAGLQNRSLSSALANL
jgi:hypothetical protein